MQYGIETIIRSMIMTLPEVDYIYRISQQLNILNLRIVEIRLQ